MGRAGASNPLAKGTMWDVTGCSPVSVRHQDEDSFECLRQSPCRSLPTLGFLRRPQYRGAKEAGQPSLGGTEPVWGGSFDQATLLCSGLSEGPLVHTREIRVWGF